MLDDKLRIQIVNCIVDFMIEAFGKGDPLKVERQHKLMTARTTIVLFIGLKSSDPQNDLVLQENVLHLSRDFSIHFIFFRANCWV